MLILWQLELAIICSIKSLLIRHSMSRLAIEHHFLTWQNKQQQKKITFFFNNTFRKEAWVEIYSLASLQVNTLNYKAECKTRNSSSRWEWIPCHFLPSAGWPKTSSCSRVQCRRNRGEWYHWRSAPRVRELFFLVKLWLVVFSYCDVIWWDTWISGLPLLNAR